MSDQARILVLGDVVGESGVRALESRLPALIDHRQADAVIVNAENAAGGFGLTCDIADRVFALGVDVITSGNHIWQKREILDYMDRNERVLRPANYPGTPSGRGWCTFDLETPADAAVLNLQGRVRLSNIDCPFRAADHELARLPESVRTVIVDFHAEDTEEKESLVRFLDGRVTLVVGTHTHVQTDDARISQEGTGSITDLGMTGPAGSVIGFDPAIARDRMVSQMPIRMEVSEAPAVIHGVFVVVDATNGRCIDIEAISDRISG